MLTPFHAYASPGISRSGEPNRAVSLHNILHQHSLLLHGPCRVDEETKGSEPVGSGRHTDWPHMETPYLK
jgi:hypothetical protein